MWAGLGNLRRAVREFSRSLIHRPHSAEAYYHRAQANQRLGYLNQADADLEKAFQLDPRVGRQT